VNSKQKHKNNPEFCKAFGNHFRKLREAKGIGMREFALKADMEYSSLSKIERGVTNTTISTALYLAEALGVSHNELFDFKFPQSKKPNKFL
jgi:transcriptional regulator with XRE-family HTH domain